MCHSEGQFVPEESLRGFEEEEIFLVDVIAAVSNAGEISLQQRHLQFVALVSISIRMMIAALGIKNMHHCD